MEYYFLIRSTLIGRIKKEMEFGFGYFLFSVLMILFMGRISLFLRSCRFTVMFIWFFIFLLFFRLLMYIILLSVYYKGSVL